MMPAMLPGLPGGPPMGAGYVTIEQAMAEYVATIRRADIHAFHRFQQAMRYGLPL